MAGEDSISIDESGWADFELDDRPRIVLAAGDFGTEVTSPVLWLRQEHGIDITCVRLSAYERDGEVLVQGQRIIPVPEAEEYMTKRRKKEEKQTSTRRSTFDVLTERGVLREGDELLFNENMLGKDWMPGGLEQRWDPEDDLWRAIVTGKTGQSNNVRWCHDNEEYSFTGLTRAVLRDIRGTDNPYFDDAFGYWTHPEFSHRSLTALREEQTAVRSRGE